MKVLLIAGHGAGQPGAIGNGFKEADLTRELVNLLAPNLKQYATVDIYDQNRNAFDDLAAGKFKIDKYDYVLEIHFNAFNGNAHGSEIYVTKNEKGISVEQKIMKKLSTFFTLRDNDSIFDGVKRKNFSVIYKVNQLGMSGALLEVCFIDNSTDMKVYQGSKNAIVEAIALGIAEGFGLKKTTETAQKPSTEKPTQPKGKKVYLPKEAKTWRVYPLDKAPVAKNAKGFLYPSKFGGLTYDILDTPQKDVITIQTRDFGKVNIYVAPKTGAIIKKCD